MTKKKTRAPSQWRTMDLHIHSPASGDFQQPEVTYLEMLQRADARGLEIIAFTDHNTVAGYRQMREEIEQLELLEKLNRILPEERRRLSEYRRLFGKLLVLPGIEFTATFGFHILAVFPPNKAIREIEHLLLELNIPVDQIDHGSATVGATTDVLTAYRLMDEAGALVIAAHANSSNGVAMRGFPFGGQTKIAYTQDMHLHALEITDLEQRGHNTAKFFSGTKPEYPRRMHCIQGSDAHRLIADVQRKKNLGLGDRATDVLLPEVSFEALKELFLSNDFARTRPARLKEEPVFDFVRSAREEGPNLVQDFHESMLARGGKLYAIIADVCAFANTNGGTLYVGLSGDPQKTPVGVQNPQQGIAQLEKEIDNRISPSLTCTLDVHETAGKKLIRILVPRGDDPPYALDDNKIYVRDEAETGLAVRDEIVNLVLRGRQPAAEVAPAVESAPPVSPAIATEPVISDSAQPPPRTGVEIVAVEERKGGLYYTMRDLRNNNMVKNVTRSSARRLWHYAITEHARLPSDLARVDIQWDGNLGLIRCHQQGGCQRYDFVQRTPEGIRFYFGVTDDGLHGPWKRLAGGEEE
ncbi:MAG: RNA-binding domain-containing protein [Chloroflexota bacterium]